MHVNIAAIIEAYPMPVVVIDAQELIIAANHKAAELFGNKFVGRHHAMAFRHPHLQAAIDQALQTQTPQQVEFTKSLNTRDRKFTANLRAFNDGDARGILISFEDISEAQDLLELRRDLVANVSHELRSPLTAILGFIETIKGPARDDPAGQARFFGMLEAQAQRMARLVQDLLTLSRVEAQERVRPKDIINLTSVLRGACENVSMLAQDNAVTLELDAPMGEINLPADQDQLSQVFINLLENAIKYGGSGGLVRIEAREVAHDAAIRGAGVQVDVKDHGPGIAEIHLARLTERFFRVDNHRSRQMGGTGLGLAIVKHIVNRHHGHIRIKSQVNEGSCFTVILPKA